jgi:hypothetical protein
MVVGTGADTASAETIPVRPYLFGNIGVGATIPGDPSSELCVINADDANANPLDGIQPTYGGLINGAPGGPPGALNVTFTAQDFATVLPSCVPTVISLETAPGVPVSPTKCTGTCVLDAVAPKTGGTLQISTISHTPPGIQATALTKIRVNLSAGQTVKTPGGALLIGGSLTGPGNADFQLKIAKATTKSQLDYLSCSDEMYVIDRNNNDDNPKSGGPTATPIDSVDPLDPEVGDPGTYLATIRGCAQVETTVAGKPVTTKILVTGNGASSVDFLSTSTTNPQTWDNTRGKVCSAAKYEINTDPLLKLKDIDSSRVLICKGQYGEVIPFSIDVREWIEDAPGEPDPFGLLHPGAPNEILATTFS